MAKQDQLQETLKRLKEEAPEEYARINKQVNDAVSKVGATSKAAIEGVASTARQGLKHWREEGPSNYKRVNDTVNAEADRLASNAKRTGKQFVSHAGKLYEGASRAVEATADDYGRKARKAAEPVKKEAVRLRDNAKRAGKQFADHAEKLYESAADKVRSGADTLEQGSANIRKRVEGEAERLGKNARRTGEQFVSHAGKLYDDASRAVEATANEYGRKARKAVEPVKKEAIRLRDNAKRTGKQFSDHAGKLYGEVASKVSDGADTLEKGSANVRNRLEAEADRLGRNAKRTGKQFTSHAGKLYDSAASRIREGADTLERGSANIRNRLEAEADRLGNNAKRTGKQFTSHAGKLYDEASGKVEGAIDQVGQYASRLGKTVEKGIARHIERPQAQAPRGDEPPSELYADYKVKDPRAKPDGMRWNVQGTQAKQGVPDSEAFRKMLQKTPSGEVVDTPFNRQPMSDEDRQAMIDSIDFRQIYKEAMENDPAAVKVLNSLSYALGGDSDLEINGHGVFTIGPDGSKQLVNIDDYLEPANKVLGASLSLASFVPGATDSPEGGTSTPTQPAAQSGQASSKVQSAGVRQAIPMEAGRGRLDELTPEEQRLLHEQYVINAAIRGDPTNLNKLLAGPYDRAETEANIGYKEAASDYYRTKANEKTEPKPREVEYQYNDFGCELVIDKNSKEQLYAKAPDGGFMPAKYFNNPDAWRQVRDEVVNSLNLKPGDKVDWHPAKGFFVKAANGDIVTLDAYAPKKVEEQSKPRAAIDSSLGTAKLYGFGSPTD